MLKKLSLRLLEKIVMLVIITTLLLIFFYGFGPKKILTYFDPVLGFKKCEYYWLDIKISEKDLTQPEYKNFALDYSVSQVFPYPILVGISERIPLRRQWQYWKRNMSNIPLLIYESSLDKVRKIEILHKYQKDIWNSFTTDRDFREVITIYQKELTDLNMATNLSQQEWSV